MKKYLVVFLLFFATLAHSESYVCKQIGYQNTKTKKYEETKREVFLTIVPEENKTVTITRIENKKAIDMIFTPQVVLKNSTDAPGDKMLILTSNSLEEPVRARLIGPRIEKTVVSGVVDLATESFIKEYKTYEERYYCLREEEKREKL